MLCFMHFSLRGHSCFWISFGVRVVVEGDKKEVSSTSGQGACTHAWLHEALLLLPSRISIHPCTPNPFLPSFPHHLSRSSPSPNHLCSSLIPPAAVFANHDATFSLSNLHTHFILTYAEPCNTGCPPCQCLAHLHRNPQSHPPTYMGSTHANRPTPHLFAACTTSVRRLLTSLDTITCSSYAGTCTSHHGDKIFWMSPDYRRYSSLHGAAGGGSFL